MAKANEVLQELGGEALEGLTVKVKPINKVNIRSFRKQSGEGISKIVDMALDNFFEGYEPIPVENGEEDDDE